MVSDARALADCQEVITATASRLEVMHTLLASFWTKAARAGAAPDDATWRLRFATAVAEIGANIVRHAYPVGAEPRRLRLRLRAFPHRIEARFTDGGEPFTQPERLERLGAGRPGRTGGVEAPGECPAALRPLSAPAGAPAEPDSDDLDDLSLFAEGGYGLQIARDAVDEVSYVRTPAGRNIWRLVKRF
jgi:serine/threonine-protein kinase RsbW